MNQLLFLLTCKPYPLPAYEEPKFVSKAPERHYVKDGMKWCNYCCESKPASEFYTRHRMGGQYLNSKCKPCQIKLAVAYKQNRRAHALPSVRIGEQGNGHEEHDTSSQGVPDVQEQVVNGRDSKGRFSAQVAGGGSVQERMEIS